MNFFTSLLLVLTLSISLTTAEASGRIVVAGDIHEFLNKGTAQALIDYTGSGGLLLLPGDFLTRPYSNNSINPPGITYEMSTEALIKHDKEVVGWFSHAPFAGTAAILGNHEFHRGETEATSILSKMPPCQNTQRFLS